MSDERNGPVTLSIAFPSGALAVREALGRLKQGLQPMELSVEDEGTIEIVLGEVLNNVVEHAIGPGETGAVEITCAPDAGTLGFEVRDGGQALPGLNLPEGNLPDLDCARDALPEGGFGWFLVRTLVSRLDYRRADGRNILRFAIPLSEPR